VQNASLSEERVGFTSLAPQIQDINRDRVRRPLVIAILEYGYFFAKKFLELGSTASLVSGIAITRLSRPSKLGQGDTKEGLVYFNK